jgi:RNA polymerase sigma factor (sigma-70 family)
MIEDKILICRFRQGSSEALGQIYEKYESLLVTIAVAVLQDRTIAQDVVHDVFVSLAESPEKLGLKGSLKHFLAVCVTNCARDRRRVQRSTQTIAEMELMGNQAQNPEVATLQQEQVQRVWSFLEQLPSEQREIVMLRLTAGLRFRQIAETLGVSVNTVQSRYRYAIKKLRTQLNGRLKK